MSSESYDYIIVGAGSAGCVLAARLSEDDPKRRILLLEAGGWDRDPLIHVPLGWPLMLQARRHDWGYDTEPEPHLDGRVVDCTRGKVVGGSSSINAMFYVRGHRSDYDRWAASGLTGWSYNDVLPYFRRQESWQGAETPFRGQTGPLTTRTSRYEDPLIDAYEEALAAAGHRRTEDYNGAEQEGFCRKQFTIRNGRRCSAAVAYLRPALRRRNLTVKANTQALRLKLDRGRATGVVYESEGRERTALAGQEVILSAGVFNTPKLLNLSGVGNADHLRAIGIEPIVDLPGVGRNLADHIGVVMACERRGAGPFVRNMRVDRAAIGFLSALWFGSGFATDLPAGAVTFMKTDPAAPAPDIEWMFNAAPITAAPYLPPFSRPFADGFGCRVVLLRPESRGEVALRSADPKAAPEITYNYLRAPKDRSALVAGIQRWRDVQRQAPLAAFIKREIAPGPAYEDGAALERYARANAVSLHHPLGTCRMGPENDLKAVVNDRLQVRGIERLRIVDASVMPDPIGGNINAAVIMIAERASDHILRRSAPQ